MPEKLKRSLGFASLLFYGVGVIIGAGIYSIIGAAARVAGYNLWLSFILGGVAALLTALSYAELVTLFPRAGAEYIYIRKALPGWRSLSFVIGFLVAVTGATTSATVALAFAGYFQMFFNLPFFWVAFILLGICTGVNILGIRQASWVTIACTLVEVGGLIVIIGFGLPQFSLEKFAFKSFDGVVSGAALSFFVYTGFEGLANLSEEAKEPEKHLPRVLLLSVAITTALYILVSIAALSMASPEALSESASPLAAAIEQRSPRMAQALGWIALVATANTALIALLVASRLLYGMAREGDMPKILSRVLSKRQSPFVAALCVLIVAVAILPFGQLAFVGSLSSFITLIVFVAVNFAMIFLRFRLPELDRPFRVPFAIKRFPLIPLLAILSCIGLMFKFEGRVYLVGIGFLLAAFAVYGSRFLMRGINSKSAS